MEAKLTKSDWVPLLAIVTALFVLLTVGWYAVGGLAVGGILVLATGGLLFVILRHHRAVEEYKKRSKREQEATFAQTEALLGLYASLPNSVQPLPETRGWAASPDFLRLVYSLIRKKKPRLVVELGSGSSTIVSGYALQQNGSGRVVSFEHLERFARQNRREVSFHGLEEQCEILEAPLETYDLDEGSWKWYSLESFDPESPIDLVIIDGPPGQIQDESRYPALPLLSKWMSEEALLILDDGDREDESQIASSWEEISGMSKEFVSTEKGAFIIGRKVK
jgi:predicted O-methyltransferase YrrM